jgi:glyoxylase-like metal-dependent hydrolase (beta-lactamase superfamily II)
MAVSGESGFVDRIYPLDGGLAFAPNKAMYSPGHFEGETVALSCNAFLIQRGDEWLLWDTGISQDLFHELGGEVIAHGIRGIVARPLAHQLAELGLVPGDVSKVILSHAHFDHIGNSCLFSKSLFVLQGAELDAMFGPDYAHFGYIPKLYESLRTANVQRVAGDLDLYGDKSVRLISTPGHTPGHMSLMLRLKVAGTIILAADIAHYAFNLEHRLVPDMNSSKEESLRSMDKVQRIAAEEGAKIWLNHDIDQSATFPHAPAFMQ